MRFTRTMNRIIQGAAIVVTGFTVANQTMGGSLLAMLPFPVGPAVFMGITIAQALAGLKAHNVNPDGTPASVPFIEDKK